MCIYIDVYTYIHTYIHTCIHMLQDLVDGDTVLVAHLVKLIDAHNTTVGEHHSARLELALTCLGILRHRRR
jgi:hypothetical protein